MDDFDLYLERDSTRIADLSVRRMAGREEISQPFEFALEVVRPASLQNSPQLGEELTLVFQCDGEVLRRVHGIVSDVTDVLATTGDWRSHRVVLSPRAYQLSLVETQDVFVGTSGRDILRSKLALYNFTESGGPAAADFEFRLSTPPILRELTVQYAESDLAFLGRVTENLGVSYFFEHDDGRDKLVLTDNMDGFCSPTDAGLSDVPFNSGGDQRGLFALHARRALVPKFFRVHDQNFRIAVQPSGSYTLEGGGPGGVVDFGSHVLTPERAETLAHVRAEERKYRQEQYRGESTIPRFAAGCMANVTEFPEFPPAGEMVLLVEVRHEAELPPPWGPGETYYRNAFVAVAASGGCYRPPRRTPKPRMPSVVTGVIQPGPNGEVGGVADLDSEGRYRVQLHFDETWASRQHASHPMRMAQPFGGQGHGFHFPLRPGTEVVVAFTNGDPDRPLIIGALPNPTSPSVVTSADAHLHRVRSPNGMLIEFGASKPGK